MPLYLVSVTRRRQPDAAVPEATYVVAANRLNALTAFESALSAQQASRVASLSVEEVAALVIMGA